MSYASLAFLLALCGLAACGPGRQAAWEKEAAGEQRPVTEQTEQAEQAEQQPQEQSKTPQSSPKKTDLGPAEQAQAAWEHRENQAELEKAIGLWDEATKQNPDDVGSWTRLSRAHYFLADAFLNLAGEKEATLATYEKGIQAGERAMMACSKEFASRVEAGDSVEDAVVDIPKEGQPALYWYATNLGKFAVAKGFTTTLFYKDRILAIMKQVLSLDETYFHGAPHRYFGAFYAKAPAFAGGDMKKSKEHFERALEIAPKYFGTKTLYAEYYATKEQDLALFKRLLQEVQEGDPTAIPGIGPEQRAEQKKAAHLIRQIDDLF